MSASRFVNIDRNSIAKKFPNPPDLSKKIPRLIILANFFLRASANLGALFQKCPCLVQIKLALRFAPRGFSGNCALRGARRVLSSASRAWPALPRRRAAAGSALCCSFGVLPEERVCRTGPGGGASDGALDGTWRGSWAALPAAGSDSVDASARRGQKPPLMAFSFSFLAHEWRVAAAAATALAASSNTASTPASGGHSIIIFTGGGQRLHPAGEKDHPSLWR